MGTTQTAPFEHSPARGELHLDGALCGDAALRLKTAVAELIAAGQAHLVADLSTVTDIDLDGLEALAWVIEQARQGGELTIRGAPEHIGSLLRIVRLDRRARMIHAPTPSAPGRKR
jgi:anti-anti-sigma regulatory factor